MSKKQDGNVVSGEDNKMAEESQQIQATPTQLEAPMPFPGMAAGEFPRAPFPLKEPQSELTRVVYYTPKLGDLIRENPVTSAAWAVLGAGLVYYAVKGMMADRQ